MDLSSRIWIILSIIFSTNFYFCESVNGRASKFILFLNPVPNVLKSGSDLQVFHSCRPSHRILVSAAIHSSISHKTYHFKLLDIQCPHEDFVNSMNTTATVHLPLYFACRPQYWMPDPPHPASVKLRLWFQNSRISKSCGSDTDNCYKYSRDRISYDTKLETSLGRGECLTFHDSCASIYHLLRHWSWSMNRELRCKRLPETVVLSNFPTYFEYEFTGLTFEVPAITNGEFRRSLRQAEGGFSRFAVSTWVFIDENCLYHLCAIIHGSVFYGIVSTPAVYIDPEGRLHVSVNVENNEVSTAYSLQHVPVRQWIQIVIFFSHDSWRLLVFNRSAKQLIQADFKLPSSMTFDVCNRHLMMIGGFSATFSFRGLVGETIMYRGQHPSPEQVVGVKSDDRMFTMRVTSSDFEEDCRIPLGEVNRLLLRASHVFKKASSKNRCDSNNPMVQIRRRSSKTNASKFSWCEAAMAPVSNWTVYTALRRIVFSHTPNTALHQLQDESGRVLLRFVRETLESDVDRVSDLLPLLRQAHCLGNSDATYLLSLLLFYGLGGTVRDVGEAVRLLLLPRQHGNRLLYLAAGQAFGVGGEGIPRDLHLSFLFYHRVALTTHLDRDHLAKEDVLLDTTRITSIRDLNEHTGENEDLFLWVKHQAERNVPWAKRRLANMWYWGTQGIRRNVNRAMDYYRSAAVDEEAEPEDMFRYGMMLLKTDEQKDVAGAVHQLGRAAERDDPQAINALAWVAEKHDHDLAKAAYLYRRAHELGNLEATGNLGIVFHTGKFPGHPVDYPTAFQLFQRAAAAGVSMSGVMLAMYLALGVPGAADSDFNIAHAWMRYVAEQNPKPGRFLSAGVKAYRQKNAKKSFINFLQAAYSGLEIANFNLAVLCDDYKTSLNHLIEQDCSCFHYNRSIQFQVRLVDAHALVRTGDCLWFGCKRVRRNAKLAIHFYTVAAKEKEFPQAYFNLGYLVEQGHKLPEEFLNEEGLHNLRSSSDTIERSDLYLAYQLYKKCEAHADESDAQLPCRMAGLRLEAWFFLNRYNKMITFCGSTLTFLLLILCLRQFNGRRAA